MSGAARVAAFVLVAAAAFAAAVGIGRAVGPIDRAAPDAHAHQAEPAHGMSALRLTASRTTFQAARTSTFAFGIRDGDRVVRDYDVAHARRMHFIVASRDLTEFQHLHPKLGSDGVWRTPLRLGRPGAYRVFADFTTAGERNVVASELYVPGVAAPKPLPAASREARVDGYRVVLRRRDGEPLRFDVTRDGNAVALQPYLGARGHLVVLREGDLEYVHAHADGKELAFETEFPSAARYRAFLQFRAAGTVRTAPFTIVVGP